MRKEDKIRFVQEWSEEIKEMPFAVLVDYRGLTVAEVTDLRARMREARGFYKVVKNNLASRAVPGTPLEGLGGHFRGPCAVAYSSENPVGVAKLLVNYGKDKQALQIKVGIIEGRILDLDGIKELSSLPSRLELLTKLAWLLNSPIQGLASALNNIVGNLARVLGQVAKHKEGTLS